MIDRWIAIKSLNQSMYPLSKLSNPTSFRIMLKDQAVISRLENFRVRSVSARLPQYIGFFESDINHNRLSASTKVPHTKCKGTFPKFVE